MPAPRTNPTAAAASNHMSTGSSQPGGRPDPVARITDGVDPDLPVGLLLPEVGDGAVDLRDDVVDRRGVRRGARRSDPHHRDGVRVRGGGRRGGRRDGRRLQDLRGDDLAGTLVPVDRRRGVGHRAADGDLHRGADLRGARRPRCRPGPTSPDSGTTKLSGPSTARSAASAGSVYSGHTCTNSPTTVSPGDVGSSADAADGTSTAAAVTARSVSRRIGSADGRQARTPGSRAGCPLHRRRSGRNEPQSAVRANAGRSGAQARRAPDLRSVRTTSSADPASAAPASGHEETGAAACCRRRTPATASRAGPGPRRTAAPRAGGVADRGAAPAAAVGGRRAARAAGAVVAGARSGRRCGTAGGRRDGQDGAGRR